MNDDDYNVWYEMIDQTSISKDFSRKEFEKLLEEVGRETTEKFREQSAYKRAMKEFIKENNAEFKVFVSQKKLQGDYYDD